MSLNHQRTVEELYDVISEEFDRTRRRPDDVLKTIVNRGFSKKSGIVLDNGCGNCRNSKVFSPDTILVAGDMSEKMLKKCRNSVAKNIHYARYTLTHLPFRRGVFDGIVCIAVVHHLKEDEVETALREMKRVLKSMGWILVSTWSRKILRNSRIRGRVEKIDKEYFSVKWGELRRFYFLMDSNRLSKYFAKTGFMDFYAFEYGRNNYILVDSKRAFNPVDKLCNLSS